MNRIALHKPRRSIIAASLQRYYDLNGEIVVTKHCFLFALVLATASIASAVMHASEVPAIPRPTTSQLRVATVQMRSTRDLETNVHKIQKHIERCAREGARVVVFPECALTGYFDDAYMRGFSKEALAAAEEKVAETCRKFNTYAVVGAPHREGNKLFNSAIVTSPEGKIIARYNKIQLAESWPVAGQDLVVAPIDGIPTSIIICHDERYPELVRLPVLAGARIVFYLSHESGLLSESKIGPYRAQIQARAVENSVYVVHANAPANPDGTGSHGHSRLIAPDGNLIEEASMFGEDVLTATLKMDRATGRLARQSIERGPLGDWWQAGAARVRVIDK